MQTLKAKLIAQFEANDAIRKQSEELAKKLKSDETAQRFELFFGQKADRVDGMKAVFEDVTVTRSCHYDGWSVAKTCGKCGVKQSSGNCTTLEQIGEQIAKRNELCYNCKSVGSNVVRTNDDILLEALRDFVHENSPD